MSLKDYQCPSCDNILSNVWSVSTDAAEPACPQCGQIMQMVYGSFTPQFIGDGFFCNDYAEKGERGDD